MNLQDIYEVIKKNKLSIPVDVKRLASELSIDVSETPMNDEISGHITKLIGDSYRIEVNSTHPENRKRFTVAHEIAHFLFDVDILEKNQICDEKLFRSSGCSILNQDRETRANRFATSLLMPTEQIKEQASSVTGVNEMAIKFKVSLAAMNLRLRSLGIQI